MGRKKKSKEGKLKIKSKRILKKGTRITIDLRKGEPIPEKKIHFKEGEIGTRSPLFA